MSQSKRKSAASSAGRDVAESSSKKRGPARAWTIAGAVGTAILAPVAVLTINEVTTQVQDRGPMVRATAVSNSGILSDGWSVSVADPVDPTQVPAGLGDEAAHAWFMEHGAADQPLSPVRLHLVGNNSSVVTISGLRAKIVSRAPTMRAARIVSPSADESGAPQVSINLDTPNGNALELKPDQLWWEDPVGTPGQPYFKGHSVTLKKGEPIDFTIMASTKSTTTRWQLELDVAVEGKPTTLPVDSPVFTTTSALPPSAYQQRWQWRWDLQPAHLAAEEAN